MRKEKVSSYELSKNGFNSLIKAERREMKRRQRQEIKLVPLKDDIVLPLIIKQIHRNWFSFCLIFLLFDFRHAVQHQLAIISRTSEKEAKKNRQRNFLLQNIQCQLGFRNVKLFCSNSYTCFINFIFRTIRIISGVFLGCPGWCRKCRERKSQTSTETCQRLLTYFLLNRKPTFPA